MRDFRHAKAMAHTLRASLAARGIKITVSQSLELIAEAFGMADWNTLSATIRAEAVRPRNEATLPQSPTAARDVAVPASLEATFQRAVAYPEQRKHQYATLEHLLLALTDDVYASAVMRACKVDLGALKGHLVGYIDNYLKRLVIDDGEPRPTAAVERVVERAVIHMQSSGRAEVNGANVLVAMFSEHQSPAAHFLQEQEMTRYDAINYLSDGIIKGDGRAV
jgi:Glyoxalase superfamily protein/Clp amino terminal domain, pathogenicity island component